MNVSHSNIRLHLPLTRLIRVEQILVQAGKLERSRNAYPGSAVIKCFLVGEPALTEFVRRKSYRQPISDAV